MFVVNMFHCLIIHTTFGMYTRDRCTWFDCVYKELQLFDCSSSTSQSLQIFVCPYEVVKLNCSEVPLTSFSFHCRPPVSGPRELKVIQHTSSVVRHFIANFFILLWSTRLFWSAPSTLAKNLLEKSALGPKWGQILRSDTLIGQVPLVRCPNPPGDRPWAREYSDSGAPVGRAVTRFGREWGDVPVPVPSTVEYLTPTTFPFRFAVRAKEKTSSWNLSEPDIWNFDQRQENVRTSPVPGTCTWKKETDPTQVGTRTKPKKEKKMVNAIRTYTIY